MTSEKTITKQILIANLKVALVIVALFCFATTVVLCSDDYISEPEICKRRWSEFLNDKGKWHKDCEDKAAEKMSSCCNARRGYLLQSFQDYSKLCPIEGDCSCSKVEVNSTVKYRSKLVNISSWTEPSFTCPHKFILESVKKPNKAWKEFIYGAHKIPYKFILYGGKNVTCNVEVNIEYIPPASGEKHNCTCSNKEKVTYSRSREAKAKISWNEPTFTCPYRFILKHEKKPDATSPSWFIPGSHKMAYIFHLHGGDNITCFVHIHVRYSAPATGDGEGPRGCMSDSMRCIVLCPPCVGK